MAVVNISYESCPYHFSKVFPFDPRRRKITYRLIREYVNVWWINANLEIRAGRFSLKPTHKVRIYANLRKIPKFQLH